MKVSEAPPPGWYPDPAGGVRLRWWDGTDWSDRFRARPSPDNRGVPVVRLPVDPAGLRSASGPVPSVDTAEIVAQVRHAARAEVERAADVFSDRARAATRQIEPLISAYTNKAIRWLKVAFVVVALLFVVWLVVEVLAKTAAWDWVFDRVEDLTEEPG